MQQRHRGELYKSSWGLPESRICRQRTVVYSEYLSQRTPKEARGQSEMTPMKSGFQLLGGL